MSFIVSDNNIEYEENGKLLAEVSFPPHQEGCVDICRTFVDDALRGKGMAGQLMELAAQEIRKTNRKAIPTCSYAVKWFEQHPDFEDILKK